MNYFSSHSLFSIDSTKFLALVISLILNILMIYIVIGKIYLKYNKNREFIFTYGMFNTVIFLICFLLSSATLSIGFSFGLFAIFSILRYRTVQIPIKEMTYFFMSISIAIINSISIGTIGLAELLLANVAIVGSTFIFEKYWENHETVKYIKYEKIDLVKPERISELIEDLKDRTGLPISRVEIGRIDFLRDIAELRVYYCSSNGHFVNYISMEKDYDS